MNLLNYPLLYYKFVLCHGTSSSAIFFHSLPERPNVAPHSRRHEDISRGHNYILKLIKLSLCQNVCHEIWTTEAPLLGIFLFLFACPSSLGKRLSLIDRPLHLINMHSNKTTCILTNLQIRQSIRVGIQRRGFHQVQDDSKYTWSVLKHVYQRRLKLTNKKYACFLLNISDQSLEAFERHKYIWDDADLKVAVDGSANYLFKRRLLHTADVISGDFDSIDANLITRLQSPRKAIRAPAGSHDKHGEASTRMPQVVETPCQKETDFTKAIRVAISLRPEIQYFFGLYFINGHRLDHLFGLINTLHLLKKNIFLLNVNSNNLSWLLSAGTHTIQKPLGQELCSLVPFTGQTAIKTQGLVYNLNPAEPSRFGGLVSTSNICQEQRDKIIVETDHELLWSIDLFDYKIDETSARIKENVSFQDD